MERDSYLPFGQPNFGDEEIAAITRVLRSGWVGMGPEVIAFENELAETFAAPHAEPPHVVTVNSCTSALFLALKVHGIGPGDEVICPSLTWCSSANVALHAGATPVFCDIDPETLAITAQTVSPKVTERTRAVVAVHYGGLAIDIAALRSVLPDGVVIIEDAAHALGARYTDGSPVGGSGNPTCFSFYANKNLSTGEGGAIATADPVGAEHARVLRLHGLPTDAWMRFTNPTSPFTGFDLTELGYKMNYTDLQAALGRVQLRRQPEFVKRRLEIAAIYHESLSRSRIGLGFQANVLDPGHARHLFAVLLPPGRSAADRDAFMIELRRRNIGASLHYAPLHRMSLYGGDARLPVTEDVASRILTLPIGANMTADDAHGVVETFIDRF